MNIPDIKLPRVVVIGAGFAGLKLSRKIDTNFYQLVLIDKNNFHTFQPLLYQVASAGLEPDSIAYPIRKILGRKKNTFFRLADVQKIQSDKKVVNTDIGDLKYDYLVVASGADNNFFGNKTVEANSLPMKSLLDALNMRSKILGNFEKALNANDLELRKELMNFVIVGAGPTGVELAGAIAELRNKILPKDFPDLDFSKMNIHLIEASSRVLSSMSLTSSEKAFYYLKRLNVNVYTETFVENFTNNIVSTSGGKEFKCDTFIWAAGVSATFPDGIDTSKLGIHNRIIVNDKLELGEDMYVLGDTALVKSDKYPDGLPMLGSVAMQQGAYLAKQFNRKAKNKSWNKFSYNDKGTMATIGRNLAVVEAGKFKFQGFFAWFVWMFVHLMLLVGFRNRVVVFVNWTWNYFRYNNGLRLIVRPFKKKRTKEVS
jgi:NADH dehydrogenase